MNTIIIYSSKYGCTAECAEILKSNLSGSTMLVDIDRSNLKMADLESYDNVILGSSIYIGTISKKMRAFCKENVDLLSKKKVGIFLCCALPKESREYFSKNFPSVLLMNAVTIKVFGGEARIDKMKTMDKLIIKAATKGDYGSLKISKADIDIFAKEFSK